MNLTEHFTLAELTDSEYALRHGINNQPDDADILENLHTLASGLERIRSKLMRPMIISSGYRSPKVNSGVGGSKTSYHLKGLAADFRVAGMTPREACFLLQKWVKDLGLRTMIYEGSWVHVDFPDVGEAPRGKVMTALFKKDGVSYVDGIA